MRMTDEKNDTAAQNNHISVADDELPLCASRVSGFVLREKVFAQMPIEHLSDVVWKPETFDKLVVPVETKSLIRTAVKTCLSQPAASSTDIISTRGNGMVIILHGKPGTGKTLTVEAICEDVGRPVFSIAISDLGVDASSVEPRLRTYLEIAEIWGCIVLIDEADVFLAKRSEHNVFSSALVGALLKVLERHRSPIFLTTNRLNVFDDAMRSRATLVIEYPPLGPRERAKLWKTFLDMEAVVRTARDISSLARYDLNGRYVPSLYLANNFQGDQK